MTTKVLIVEDNAIIAEATKLMVNEIEGFEVVQHAFSYEEVEEILLNNKIELALVDINLESTKDGYDVSELLIQKQIPFMHTSSYNEFETHNRTKGEFITKPINKFKLKEKLMLLTKIGAK